MERETIDLPSYIQGIRDAYFANRELVPARIANPEIDLPHLQDYLQMPGENPYGRKLIYQDNEIEVILMNWGKNRSSLPHDHGPGVENKGRGRLGWPWPCKPYRLLQWQNRSER